MTDTRGVRGGGPLPEFGTEPAPAIVVGYSDKPEGRAALERAIAEAALRDARLIVLPTTVDDAGLVGGALADCGVPFEVREVLDELDPAEALLAVAEQSAAEFIVIGLRRRSPVGKLLLGGNAQRVLLEAACPVLAVKAESAF